MFSPAQKHDRSCWCQNCWEEKLLHPEIVTEEYKDYAEGIAEDQGLNRKYENKNP